MPRFAFLILALAALIPTGSQAQTSAGNDARPRLGQLIEEALKGNPEIAAARSEWDAARSRISPAGALDDPMAELGVVNVPNSLRFNREDMTMRMFGLSQKLPYPGKRALRRDVAAKDADAVEQGYRETANRVAREVKVAYFELALAQENARLITGNTQVLQQFRQIAEGRYSVGQTTQSDVLKAQTQLARMSEELLRMQREIPVMEAELARLIGRGGASAPLAADLPPWREGDIDPRSIREAALRQRPQLLGLRALMEKADKAAELARSEYSPDFDVRFQYGLRDNMLDGTRRPDLFSLVFAISLPIWGSEKIDHRVAEARSMRDQASSLYRSQQNDILARLHQQATIAEQSRRSGRLYETAILPQAELAVESALAAYRVSRVDLLTLLDSQMSLFNYRIARAGALATHHKALAEIDLLTGAPPQ